MNLIELLRAKSEKEGEEGKNILLKDHIIETLERAKQLKEFVETNGDTITYSLLEDEKFFMALAIALILHDLGKINYDFQRRVHDKESDDWKELGEFLKPLKHLRIRDHEVLSAVWASVLLDDNVKEWKDWFLKIRTAILLHHYNNYYIGEKDLMEIVQDYLEDVEIYLEFVVSNWLDFEKFLNGLLDILETKFNEKFIIDAVKIIRDCIKPERVEDLLKLIKNRGNDISMFAEFYKIDNNNPNYDFLVFLGCLRRCDYCASGEINVEIISEIKKIYSNLEDKIKEKIRKEPDWQKKILKEVEPFKSIVLIAPTGSGKTEFALLWSAKNSRKLIYTLPLRVALNDLFWRFREYYFGGNVDILHSTAFIEYLEEEQKGKVLDVEKQLNTSKHLATPILLTTPDQVFLTSLNYYGSDKVIAVYPLSSIVIDEIQTYDPEMASIIIKTLQIVKELNGVTLVMTATLPPYFEPFFFKELGFEKIDTKSVKDEVKNYNLKRHRIKIVNDWLVEYEKANNEYLIKVNKDQLDKILKEYSGKNIFIVLNNVSKAVEVYKLLKDKRLNVFLLHSRLIEEEKDRRIKIIKILLKNSKSREEVEEIEELKREFENIDVSKPVIVVATQIIEASVDLDLDIMITEVSPIDSQVQRWGRIYRNRDGDYGEEQANIVIFIGKSEDGRVKIDRGTGAIYDKRVVEKTAEILGKYDGKVMSYEDERHLITEVFEQEVEIKEPELIKSLKKPRAKLKELYIAEIQRNLEFLKYFTVEKKTQAQRLFRKIAGIQVVVPAVMRIYGDEIDKPFAKIVENPESNRKTWREIEDEIGVKKLELKKRLYQYSINIPIFYLEDLMHSIMHEFKGFYVVSISDDDAQRIMEYGIEGKTIKALANYEEDYLV